MAALDGAVLRLGDGGMVELEGRCAPAPARGRRLGVVGGWLGRFAAHFDACEVATALRARVEEGCDAVRGVVRTAGGRVTFRAARIAACGDGVVSTGEDCDDVNDARGDCCDACRAEPGCYVPCERTADCAPQAVCERDDDRCVAAGGICKPRYPGRCPDGGDFAVYGCDGNAYPTECDAWDAGVTVQGGDGLNWPVGSRCRPDAGLGCRDDRFCEMAFRCLGVVRPRLGGICVEPAASCAGVPGPAVCGCDGRRYRNDCERRAARVQIQCHCADEAAVASVACELRRGPDQTCDCS